MSRPPKSPWRALALLCAASFLVGCGGSSASTAVSTTPVEEAAEAPPPVPTVPSDLWQLVPPDALVVADLDVSALRRWSHTVTLKQWAQRYGCAPDEDLALLDGIDRVVLAAGEDGFLVLVQGHAVDESDVPEAMREEIRVAAVTFRSLEPGTVLVASKDWNDAVTTRLTVPSTESVRTAAMVSTLSPLLPTQGSLLLVMAAPPVEVSQEVAAALTQWGVSKIGKGLSAHPYWGLEAHLEADNAGVAVRGAVAGGVEATTTALVDAVNGAFWQAGLVMRLFGLPAVLSTARFHQSAGTATVDVQATGSDFTALAPRVEELIKARAPACSAPPAGPIEVTP